MSASDEGIEWIKDLSDEGRMFFNMYDSDEEQNTEYRIGIGIRVHAGKTF